MDGKKRERIKKERGEREEKEKMSNELGEGAISSTHCQQ
jgi:hypothetical protein